jgi:hypothetical protein
MHPIINAAVVENAFLSETSNADTKNSPRGKQQSKCDLY